MPRNRTRRALGSHNKPPPQDTVLVVASGTVGNGNAIEAGKALLTAAASSATMRTIHGRPVMANDEGANLVETMLTCRSEIGNLRHEFEKRRQEFEERIKEQGNEHEKRIKELEQQNRQLTGLYTLYLDVREPAELGATHLIDTAPDGVNVHREICGLFPTGVSLVIDTTGSPQRIEEGLKSLRQRGKLVLIGVPPAQFELGVSAIEHMNTGRVVMGCIEGDCVPKEAIAKLIQWYREGRFPFDKLITYFEAHEFKQALDRLDEGTVVKAVLKWNNTQ